MIFRATINSIKKLLHILNLKYNKFEPGKYFVTQVIKRSLISYLHNFFLQLRRVIEIINYAKSYVFQEYIVLHIRALSS